MIEEDDDVYAMSPPPVQSVSTLLRPQRIHSLKTKTAAYYEEEKSMEFIIRKALSQYEDFLNRQINKGRTATLNGLTMYINKGEKRQ